MQKKSQCADFKQSTMGTDFSSLLFLIVQSRGTIYLQLEKHLMGTLSWFIHPAKQTVINQEINKSMGQQVFSSWILKIRNHTPEAQNWRAMSRQQHQTTPLYSWHFQEVLENSLLEHTGQSYNLFPIKTTLNDFPIELAAGIG